jgi:hypothetical protein
MEIDKILNWAASREVTLILNLISVTFAAAAIIGTMIALWMGFRHSNKLGKITNSLSTRYVGSFPEHVRKIFRAVQDAQESIVVLSDCVDYGSISQTRQHARLFQALQCALDPSRYTLPMRLWRRLRGRKETVTVNFLIWGKPQLISAANKLNSPEEFKAAAPETIRKFTEGLFRYLPEFVNQHRSEFDVLLQFAENDHTDWTSPAARQAYQCILQALHAWEVQLLTSRGAMIEGQHFENGRAVEDSNLPARFSNVPKAEYFFWIIDDEKAVVLFNDPGEDALAFFTQDFDLMKLLRHTFRRKYREATGRPWIPH